MADVRRFVRRLLGRDPQPVPSPIPSLSPVNNSPSLTAAAATQQTPSSGDTGRQSSHISVLSAGPENPVVSGAHGPFATPSDQHVPATTTSPGALPTQHQRVERRTPTNSTVASRLTFRSRERSDTNGTRRLTIASFASRDLERTAKRKSERVVTHPESYPTYCLEWESLRQWLENSFPKCHFGEVANTNNDSYVFYIPRSLTPEEKEQIYKLRSDYHSDRE